MRCTLWVIIGFMAACLPAAAQTVGKWKTFVSQEGGFSVRMPGTPAEEKGSKEPSNNATQTHTFIFSTNDSAYFVSYTDFQADELNSLDAAAVLKAGRDGGIKNVKGHLLSDHEITLDGNPGREVTASFPLSGKEGRAKFRIYLVKARLYMVLLVGPYARVVRPETDTFLQSLRLVNTELQDGWKTFTSTEGQFAVRLPELPKEDSGNLEGGGVIHQFIVDKKDHAYIISYNLIADGAPHAETIPTLLNQGRDAMLKSMGGTRLQERDISLGGYPGKAIKFIIRARNGIVLVRAFVVRDRYYQVMVLGEKKAMETAGADKYLASFQLLGTSDPSEWKKFTSKEQGFAIEFPGVPSDVKLTEDKTFFHLETNHRVYQVICVALPETPAGEGKTTQIMEAALAEETKAVHGTIKSQKRIKIGDYPGLEARFIINPAPLPGSALGIERFYVVGKKLYKVYFITDEAQPVDSSFRRFFDSFELLKQSSP